MNATPQEERAGPPGSGLAGAPRALGIAGQQYPCDPSSEVSDQGIGPALTEELIPAYAAAGLAVLPLYGVRHGRCTCWWRGCPTPGKHPRIPSAHRRDDPAWRTCRGGCGRPGHGVLDATTDLGQIAEWFAQFPGCNWGVRPPVGSFVLDVDPRNGGDTTLGALEHAHGPLPGTLTAQTGSGGLHLWFGYGAPVRGKLGPGIDVKTNSGYLVAPPSVHAAGGRYFWLDERDAARPPEWLRRRLAPPAARPVTGRGGNVDALVRFVLDAPEGERNSRLYWAGCRAAESGADPAPLVAAGVQVGLSEDEARRAARGLAVTR